MILRGMAIVYALAFASIWAQVDGLFGTGGILPVTRLMDSARDQLAHLDRLAMCLRFPTVFWLGASDQALHAVCGAGVLLALLAFLGLAPAACFASLWLLYLSLCTVGDVFLSFQWDILLLEAGFLTVFLAPPVLRLRPGQARPPSLVVLWLFRWLLFRLMFSSGIVKLASGDETWRNLTALQFHYETQPLPTWIGWYVHQLGPWFQQASVGAMFAIELAAPFLIPLGRTARFVAFLAFVSLQGLIIATGNYGFFNYLTLVLCLSLLDDAMLPARCRPAATCKAGEARVWPVWVIAPVTLLVVNVSSAMLLSTLSLGRALPAQAWSVVRWAQPFRIASPYGLFAVMTTSRPEIEVEGSEDGVHWSAYRFRYKPGDPVRRPSFVAPHMPRLDWQMWFAALSTPGTNPWFLSFLGRLLKGSPDVLGLLESNPFPVSPPRHVRAVLYDYRFTRLSAGGGEQAAGWWKRKLKGLYQPPVRLHRAD
jgi:hypothetical protein